MDRFEKIRMGMRLIREGCEEDTKCGVFVDGGEECPFKKFCRVIMDSDEITNQDIENLFGITLI